MKTKTCLLSAVSILLLICCTEIPEGVSDELADNSEKIEKIIAGFDTSLKEYINSDLSLNNEDLSDFFLKELESLNVETLEISQNNPNFRTTSSNLQLSNEFHDLSSTINNTTLYSTNQAYQNSILSLGESIKSSNLALYEKQILTDNIKFMNSFVNWMHSAETVYGTYSCTGWWACWGRCAAGVLGSAITGGLGGCATGGLGGAVGTIVPGIGNAAGVVSGCVAAGVIGAIGGGLMGSATFCN